MRIENQNHSKEAFLYLSSKILERSSYYGFRSLIVLYMISEVLKMETTEALSIYGWFVASFVFSNVIGALIGDLLLGNKKSVIIGGLIQALGTFILCIPSTEGLYTGMLLIIIGNGLYNPNIIAKFGKLYLSKTKLLDAGFTMFYFAINIGAFLGVLIIGLIGEKYGWNIGFITAGVLMSLSLIPVLFLKEDETEFTLETKRLINQRAVLIVIAFVVIGLFWATFELHALSAIDLQYKLPKITNFDIPSSLWQSLNFIFLSIGGTIAIIFWSYFHKNQFFKLAIGSVFGALSFASLFLISYSPPDYSIILYILSFLFFSISEINIAPIFYSIVTQHANPKYLAIIISLLFIPIGLLSYVFGKLSDLFDSKLTAILLIGLITMTVMAAGLALFNRKSGGSESL